MEEPPCWFSALSAKGEKGLDESSATLGETDFGARRVLLLCSCLPGVEAEREVGVEVIACAARGENANEDDDVGLRRDCDSECAVDNGLSCCWWCCWWC